jgi:hypothetical protein
MWLSCEIHDIDSMVIVPGVYFIIFSPPVHTLRNTQPPICFTFHAHLNVPKDILSINTQRPAQETAGC